MADEPVRFLLVEDDDDHATLVVRNLQGGRVENDIRRVRNGVDALAYLRQQGEFAGRPRPHVVLLDLKLPRMDGHQVLQTIKDDPSLCDIPVVVLTTSDNELDRARAYRHHANSYLVKPLDFDQFRRMVEDLNLYWCVWNRPAPSASPRRGHGPAAPG